MQWPSRWRRWTCPLWSPDHPRPSPYPACRWELQYTTSQSILGSSKPAFLRPSGPIYQLLDGPNLRAANKESAPLFNQVRAGGGGA